MKFSVLVLFLISSVNSVWAQQNLNTSEIQAAQVRARAICKRVFAMAQEQCITEARTNNENGYGVAFRNCNLNSTNPREVTDYIFKQHKNGSCDIVYIFRDSQTSLRTYTGMSSSDPLAATYETADAIYTYDELTEFVFEGSLRHTILGFIGHSPALNSSGSSSTTVD